MKVTRIGRTRPYLTSNRLGSGSGGMDPGSGAGGEAPVDACCDPAIVAPADKAQDASAVTLGAATATLIQTKVGSSSATLTTTPTAGRLLVAWLTARTATPNVTTTGWTTIAAVSNNLGFTRYGKMLIKVSDGTAGVIATSLDSGQAAETVLMEWSGSYASVFAAISNVAATTNMDSGGAVAATDSSVVLGGAEIGNQDFVTHTVAPDTGTTEVYDTGDTNPGAFSPASWVGYRVVASAGSEIAGGTISTALAYCGVTILITDAPAWNLPSPRAVDGSDTTYETIIGANVLRVDLGAAHLIIRARLRIATATAGSRTYVIRGANAPDFSDAVTLSTVTFTATGSYTVQDVAFLWVTSTAYRYFELTGNDETRRIHTFELREAAAGVSIVTDPTSGAAAEVQDALDSIAWPCVGLTITYASPGVPSRVSRTDGYSVTDIIYVGALIEKVVTTRAGTSRTITPTYTGADITAISCAEAPTYNPAWAALWPDGPGLVRDNQPVWHQPDTEALVRP